MSSRNTFAKLRGLMREYGDGEDDVARCLLLSRASVSNRMRCKQDWKLGEMYLLMKRYRVPNDQLHEIFPYKGIKVAEARDQ